MTDYYYFLLDPLSPQASCRIIFLEHQPDCVIVWLKKSSVVRDALGVIEILRVMIVVVIISQNSSDSVTIISLPCVQCTLCKLRFRTIKVTRSRKKAQTASVLIQSALLPSYGIFRASFLYRLLPSRLLYGQAPFLASVICTHKLKHLRVLFLLPENLFSVLPFKTSGVPGSLHHAGQAYHFPSKGMSVPTESSFSASGTWDR